MLSAASRTSPRGLLLLAALSVVVGLLYTTPAVAVEIPSAPSTAYQQTNGREQGLGIGDYYSNVAGDDTEHFIDVEVGCGWPVATPITVALFDPEINDGHGVAAPYPVDEIRDDLGADSTDEADAEDTEYRLLDPLGNVLRDWTTFTPNGGSARCRRRCGATSGCHGSSGRNDGKAGVTLTGGENRVDLDFGSVGIGVIGDTVWHDLNGSGVQDFASDGVFESGIEGVTVTVIWAGPDNVLGTPDDYHYDVQATDGKGNYLYSRLPFGEFQVKVGNVDALVLQVANIQVVTLNAADGGVAGAVLTVDFPFRVLATSESLPHTGADTDRIAGLGLILLLGGAFLLLITRKRRENA